MKWLDRAKTPLFPDPIAISAVRDGIGIDVALEWNDSYYENVLPFTNNIPQRDGGTHLAAFRAALTRTLNSYAEKSGIMPEKGRRVSYLPPSALAKRWRSASSVRRRNSRRQ